MRIWLRVEISNQAMAPQMHQRNLNLLAYD